MTNNDVIRVVVYVQLSVVKYVGEYSVREVHSLSMLKAS